MLHGVFVIHCDIKPENFMINLTNDSIKLVAIDFGMSRLFVESRDTNAHLPNKMSDSLFGTPKYTSYNIHLGNKYSRRDDLISVGYLMMTVFDIALPWSALPVIMADNNTSHGQRLLSHCDQSQRLLSHCDHPHNLYRRDLKMCENLVEYLRKTDFADMLILYFTDVYALKYDEAPNYTHLANYFIIK